MCEPDYLPMLDRHWTDIGPITTRKWLDEVTYILSQDPRPAYQDDPTREYKLDYAGFTVTFTVKEGTAFVQKIEKM
jgi:hypothetical protein